MLRSEADCFWWVCLSQQREFVMRGDQEKFSGGCLPRRKGNRLTKVAEKIINGLKRRFDLVIRKTGRKQSLSLGLVNDHNEIGGVKTLCSNTNRRTDFTAPILYDQHLEVIRQPAIKAAVPDGYLLELTGVGVVGSTRAVVRDRRVLHPELLHTKTTHDSKAPDLYRFTDAARGNLNFNTFTPMFGGKRVKVGIHLLKEHSFNYYHWLFECLPRLKYLIENIGSSGHCDKFTILIDQDILEEGIIAMRRLITFPFEIKKVRRGELVYCDRLFYTSPLWYSLDNSKHRVDTHRDYAVDKYAVETIRHSFLDLKKCSAPTRKIYLRRAASQVRRIINSDEVEQVMRNNGFEILYAHDFSFADQVALFSSSKVVVGASGAAFSNMVFMQPGTKAVIFSPKQLEVFNYYIFQQQADVAQVELAHLLAVPAKQDNFFIHDNFFVNVEDLEKLVKQLTI